MPPQGTIWAAGGVLYRTGADGNPEYLLVHRPRYHDWSLPKGKLDPRERFEQAARREVREETGFATKVAGAIGTIFYETANGNPKIVRYWLLEARKGKFKPNTEVDKVKWLPAARVKQRLTYSRDKEVFARGHAMVKRDSSSRVFLIRHAEAGIRNSGKKPDHLRPLDKWGRKQATAIRDHVTTVPLTRLVTSSFVRCRQTLKPTSKTLGLPLEDEASLIEGAHPEMLARFIGGLKGEQMAMSSHGDVISRFISMLHAEGVPLDGPLEWRKGSMWVLDVRKRGVVRGRYIPPLT